MITTIRNIIHGIQNLLYWFPVIWHDRDWDYCYTLKILRHKLVVVEKDLQNDISVNGWKEARNVHIARLLIDRILADDYHNNAMLGHTRQYGEYTFDFHADTFGVHYKKEIPEELQRVRKNDYRKWVFHSIGMQKQDIDTLFTIMRKHLLHWWS